MSDLQHRTDTSNALHPVNIRRLRLVYRDLIAASAAGENIFRVLSGIAPVCRVMQYTLVWTGDPAAPLAIRREAAFANGDRELRPIDAWYRIHAKSSLAHIIQRESSAYYPDATRPYAKVREFGLDAYKLVIGSKLISISFDTANPLAHLETQRWSLLDMIAQALLDYSRRQLRHLQEQYIQTGNLDRGLTTVVAVDRQVAAYMQGETDEEQGMLLMQRHAKVLESFFGFSHVEYLMSHEIHNVLFGQQERPVQTINGKTYSSIMLAVSEYPGLPELPPAGMSRLEIPLVWGANNEDDLFLMRLYAWHQVNPHVRRELLLNQSLLAGKADIESLFEKRYRELRIAQDTTHFRRCKFVRTSVRSLAELRDHLVNSMPEYGSFPRGLERELVFPRFADWQEPLRRVFVDIEADWLEFQDHVRLADLVEYRYLDIRTPPELLAMLQQALRVDVKLRIRSDYAVLSRLSDQPDGEEGNFSERVLFFNDATTISVLIPGEVSFPFQRVVEMFSEYLESIGEGIGRLFQSISLMTGIQNRGSLVRKLEHLINQVQYSHLVNLEVSSLDIVSFKIFNELFGHPFGDRVIRLVAMQLDSVAPDMAFHVSGDEYYLIHCWYGAVAEPWIGTFFRTYNIISEAEFRTCRKKLEAFVRGQPLALPLSDVSQEDHASTPLGSYRLVDLIGNFFTRDANGATQLKKYSRTGNDYHNVIWDPQRRIQALVDQVWSAVQSGKLELDDPQFTSFVLQNSTIGDRIFILPKLTIGTVRYKRENILPYASDIIVAADAAAGKNKK